MSKTEFKPENFSFASKICSEVAADEANKLLPEIKEAWKAEMLKDAVVVYALENDDNSWGRAKGYRDKRQALLIDIQPIVRECVKHEADLFGTRKYENSFPCIHCGLELVAEWKAKK